MTLAQDLSAVWASVRPVIEESFHGDDYEITRDTQVSDGRGGTTTTAVTVEAGLCSLVVGGSQGDEYVSGSSVIARAPYWADMPWDTEIETNDRITIVGREFAVTAVKREGDWGVSVRAELEERS